MSNYPPLPPIPQSFFDENRERFGADSQQMEIKSLNKCPHFVERKSWNEVKCKLCGTGWYDQNRFIIEDGKIAGVREK